MEYRHQSRPSADRLLSRLCTSPPSSIHGGDELSEDDLFFTFQNPPPSTSSTSTPPLSVSTSIHRHQYNHKSLNGILAALPESESESSVDCRSHKPSPPSSSCSRMIPRSSIERRQPAKYHQSAPMHMPLQKLWHHKGIDNDDDDDNGDDDDGQMLPPHEIVARQLAKSPALSCSVLEGAGRTLKGRDLRQVRNAVFRQTGFID